MSKINLEVALEDDKIELESNPLATKSGDFIHPRPMVNREITLFLDKNEMARMLAVGKERFAHYEVMVNDLITEANQLIVSNQETHNQAVELGAKAKKKGKEIREEKRKITEHANGFVKGLTLFCKPFEDGCDKIEQITKNKNRDWLMMQELERRKQEKILQDAQREVQAKVDAEAKKAGVETIQLQPANIKQEEKIITRTEFGSAHLSHKKNWKIINLSLIPREIFQRCIERMSEERQREFLNPTVSEEIKRNPELEIPGILIFDDTNIVYRS